MNDSVCVLCYLLQRYYYYIHHGIDTEHVAPMEDVWLENVLSLISDNLKVCFTARLNRKYVSFKSKKTVLKNSNIPKEAIKIIIAIKKPY